MNEDGKQSVEDRQNSTQQSGRDDQTVDREEFYACYLEQLRRMSCPGCGETDQYF